MQEVARIYQIAVVITDNEKRMVIASQGNDGKPELNLDISGEEAVTRYQALIDLLDRQPTRN